MTLCDASALIAIISNSDRYHSLCVEALAELESPLVSTWPCIVEAMYLFGKESGWRGQSALWEYINDEVLELFTPSDEDVRKMSRLMHQYRDLPMDLGDASLVAAADALGSNVIFTLDNDFRIYRFKGKQAFKVVP